MRHAYVTGHTGEVFVVLICSYKRKFPLIRMFLQKFITVPGVITGTFSGISQHPSKALIIIFSFYSAHDVVVEKIEIATICLTSSLPDKFLATTRQWPMGINNILPPDLSEMKIRFLESLLLAMEKFVVHCNFQGVIITPLVGLI